MKDRRLYPSRALHGQVAHEVGRRIASGVIPEGAILPREAELSAQFGVSRQAVREGLKVLAAKGLVASRRRTGTRVLPRSSWNLLDPDVLAWHPPERIPPDFLKDLYELRYLVEPAAAAGAAIHGTREEKLAIGEAIAQMRDQIDDLKAFTEADVDFHVLISLASGNALFEQLSATYAPLLRASFALQVTITPRETVMSFTLPSHSAVYEAIAARDASGAREAMQRLLQGASSYVDAIVSARRSGSSIGG